MTVKKIEGVDGEPPFPLWVTEDAFVNRVSQIVGLPPADVDGYHYILLVDGTTLFPPREIYRYLVNFCHEEKVERGILAPLQKWRLESYLHEQTGHNHYSYLIAASQKEYRYYPNIIPASLKAVHLTTSDLSRPTTPSKAASPTLRTRSGLKSPDAKQTAHRMIPHQHLSPSKAAARTLRTGSGLTSPDAKQTAPRMIPHQHVSASKAAAPALRTRSGLTSPDAKQPINSMISHQLVPTSKFAYSTLRMRPGLMFPDARQTTPTMIPHVHVSNLPRGEQGRFSTFHFNFPLPTATAPLVLGDQKIRSNLQQNNYKAASHCNELSVVAGDGVRTYFDSKDKSTLQMDGKVGMERRDHIHEQDRKEMHDVRGRRDQRDKQDREDMQDSVARRDRRDDEDRKGMQDAVARRDRRDEEDRKGMQDWVARRDRRDDEDRKGVERATERRDQRDKVDREDCLRREKQLHEETQAAIERGDRREKESREHRDAKWKEEQERIDTWEKEQRDWEKEQRDRRDARWKEESERENKRMEEQRAQWRLQAAQDEENRKQRKKELDNDLREFEEKKEAYREKYSAELDELNEKHIGRKNAFYQNQNLPSHSAGVVPSCSDGVGGPRVSLKRLVDSFVKGSQCFQLNGNACNKCTSTELCGRHYKKVKNMMTKHCDSCSSDRLCDPHFAEMKALRSNQH